MLRIFAAALVATMLAGGSAFAAETSGSPGTTATTPAAGAVQSAPASTVKSARAAKPAKLAKHARAHSRKHLARGKGTAHQARHSKPVATHQASTTKTSKRS